jgi:cytochrome c oxidase assembly factor CtaG
VAAVALALWYARAVRRLVRAGGDWPARRSVLFGAGLALLVWTSCGFLQDYAASLYWAWTAQTLALFLVVPFVLLVGQPIQLARTHTGPDAATDRFLRSRAGRILGNPLVGPALVPLLSGVLFFGPVPAWAITVAPFGWILHLLLVAVGGLILMPVIGLAGEPSSLAVGLTLAIGSFELVLDAIPGIALRLHNSVVTSYFDHRSMRSWSPDAPFLLLVYRRWLRADARDAAEIDAVLDAERIARSGLDQPGAAPDQPDAPWWLSDPAMRDRLRRER